MGGSMIWRSRRFDYLGGDGATKANIVVSRVVGRIVQIEGEDTGIGSVVPIGSP
ncbi:MAG: hypothetical protein BWY29_00449 [Microgenomates group bacterium ADurb.Bin238]|jgi:hypothetical protein|nr:MAG: hypothetical protein BWY29_00449 [Microgenomates group bacterium ADurb.Bin238]